MLFLQRLADSADMGDRVAFFVTGWCIPEGHDVPPMAAAALWRGDLPDGDAGAESSSR